MIVRVELSTMSDFVRHRGDIIMANMFVVVWCLTLWLVWLFLVLCGLSC